MVEEGGGGAVLSISRQWFHFLSICLFYYVGSLGVLCFCFGDSIVQKKTTAASSFSLS